MAKEMRPTYVMINSSKVYENREKIKALGGQWDSDSKRWWVEKHAYETVMKLLDEVSTPTTGKKIEVDMVTTANTVEPKKKRGRPKKVKGDAKND
jgi:hypothetical protein